MKKTEGAAAAQEIHRAATSDGEAPRLPSRPAAAIPRWERATQQLMWRGSVIKTFRQPAVNQELILAAFEEQGWPLRIDDPLPRTKDIDPKVRLHDTIKRLNRNHLFRIIRFGGDGCGRGIRWTRLKRR
jgi:hypothetical protein